MKKMTLRKALAPAALAVVLLTTGCDTDAMTIPAQTVEPSVVAPTAAPSTESPLATSRPVPTTATPESIPAAPPVAEAPANGSDIVAEAKATIDTIAVKGRAPKTGYDRDNFGPAWADVDKNGCDTRNDILARDLTNETFKDGTKECVVATGTLADKYTGKTIEFVRGQDTSKAVHVDHVYPLSLSWQQGSQQWTEDKRKQFANDPLNLIAADGPANSSKGDSGPGSWLPPNKAFHCEYIANFVSVTKKYELSMNPGDFDASKRVLAAC